ncbi:MAG: DNA integrity scanning diadenylate cyclase DisA [Atopobiaceae bacterium]|jgi:diadenylate cyclase|nr:DNA integrity scanning diadenylate cyclase DisA [Atopobiaceae bacterium]MCH4119763.1 DNA integrity scanning diadenylate cyclase DisA [Atopobiaceae bacterium]MCI1318970.1 DNA integrity scanning diadenylate cyclase DisA [Atopobiaceae bacterium]MCI1388836.1 DNA integrity scanning diadenylate cyclase DisA [Atopobiaceae bacterium]MCI1432544.1 DNA integrity scanning diadenylate cyclase DisA [Atopobiaceae bacterium]
MDSVDQKDIDERMKDAVRMTAPGTALRHALDMTVDGGLGALICIGDTDNVIANGEDGFPLDISFTSNRLFELSKMDGAIVVDGGLTRILRANYHLNPDSGVYTAETGTRHRTAARMSQVTHATVIAISQRRQVVTVYVAGRSHVLRRTTDIMTSVSQLLVTLQNTRTELDRKLWRLSTLELENLVTLADVAGVVYLFEVLMTASRELGDYVLELGSEGRTVSMRLDELAGDMDATYTLLVRDYAADSSPENAQRIRLQLRDAPNTTLRSPQKVAAILGYPDLRPDSIMSPLGLRTLSRTSVIRDEMADKIVDEYGSLSELVDDLEDNPNRLDEIGVENPTILADRLLRMRGLGE